MDRPRASQVICTICSKNYLHFARTLMDSVERTHPDWDRVVLLVDRVEGAFDPTLENFRVIEIDELDIPHLEAFCFRYTILELNTAAKPWLFELLFGREGYQRAIYLDPDILMLRRMEEVEAAFEGGAFCVLTPHLTGSVDDARKPSETDVLRAGAYNLGFLALRRHAELDGFLAWWKARLERLCVVDMDNGLFVDQKWMDLVPGMREDVRILRHEGYNVAYWNLSHRKVVLGDDGPKVNGVPLVFFHFSGLDPRAPAAFSKHQDRYRLGTLGPVRALVESYCNAVLANGLEVCVRWPYAFARLADGVAIPDVLRAYLRRHPEWEQSAPGLNPFALRADFFNEPFERTLVGDPLVSRFVHAVWEDSSDLQATFPDPSVEHRVELAAWFAENRLLNFEVDPVWVKPVEESLRRLRGAGKPPRASLDPALAHLRRVGKRFVPKGAKRWLRDFAQPPLGGGDSLQQTLRPVMRMLPFFVRHRLRTLVLPVGATLPRRARLRPIPRVIRLGFHTDEDGRRSGRAWIGEEASVRVAQAELGPVRVEGAYSPEPFVRAGGIARTMLEVAVNGEPVGRLVLEQEGNFETTFDVPKGFGKSAVTISLRADQTFIPMKAGLGQDTRALSLEISRIELGGRALVDFALTSERDASTPSDTGINVVGYLRSELGVGEAARMAVLSADAVGLPVALVDYSAGCSSRLGDTRFTHRFETSNPHPVNVICVNADQFPLVYSTLGPAFFEKRINVGFWMWELPEFPDEWLSSFDLVDEIWAPSRFTQEAIAAKSPVPVIRMPIPVQIEFGLRPSREKLGLPKDRFLFLTMWDMHSFQGRKNPEAVLEAYRRAFPARSDVGLVVKTMNTATYPEEWERFRELIRNVDGVFVIDSVLSREEVWGLEAACDCFVSLHRSEGFGLGLAECMALGKPVVATGWSGNVDFTREDNSCVVRSRLIHLDRDHGPYRRGQIWADPDPEHAAHHMRRLVDDVAFRERIAEAGRQTVREEFSPEAVGRRYVQRLEALRYWRT